MFGCIVAGRMVQTDMQVVSPTHSLFLLPDAATVRHIVVFLTGARAFDAGLGAAVHYNSTEGEALGRPWRPLGFLSNEKGSAVFRLQDLAATEGTIKIGLSIEPLAGLAEAPADCSRALAVVPAGRAPACDPVAIAQRVGESLFNYVVSFAEGAAAAAARDPSAAVIPVDLVQRWFATFIRRIQSDASFLSRPSAAA